MGAHCLRCRNVNYFVKLGKGSQHPCTHTPRDIQQTGGLKLDFRGPGVRFITTSEPNHSLHENPGIGFGCSRTDLRRVIRGVNCPACAGSFRGIRPPCAAPVASQKRSRANAALAVNLAILQYVQPGGPRASPAENITHVNICTYDAWRMHVPA